MKIVSSESSGKREQSINRPEQSLSMCITHQQKTARASLSSKLAFQPVSDCLRFTFRISPDSPKLELHQLTSQTSCLKLYSGAERKPWLFCSATQPVMPFPPSLRQLSRKLPFLAGAAWSCQQSLSVQSLASLTSSHKLFYPCLRVLPLSVGVTCLLQPFPFKSADDSISANQHIAHALPPLA